jgi:hypothetical protein
VHIRPGRAAFGRPGSAWRSAVVALSFVGAAALAAVLTGAGGAVRVAQLAAALAVTVLGALSLRRPKPARTPAVAEMYEAGRRQWSSLYQLETTVMIGTQSRHHYDLGLRPRLQRTLSAVAAGRCGADLAARPAAGEELLGPQLWPLVDPARPASRDSRPGGVDLAALERLLDRIERLAP